MVELAVVIDAGEPFVTATYILEGNGPLALECYEIITGIQATIQVHHWPNTTVIIKWIATVTRTEQYSMTYATNCVQTGFGYFEEKFFGANGLGRLAYVQTR